MTNRERQALIADVQTKLLELARSVCPLCAERSVFFCEVMDGVHNHVDGQCKASEIRVLMSHVDDVRDQFANADFNPEQKARALWCFEVMR